MRKIKNIAVVTALVLVVIMVFAGCSCSNNSDNPNNQNNSTEQNSVNNQTANNSNTESNTDFEPTVSLDQRKAVKPEDYINGKNFDLDGYAEALGYTKLNDPKGCVIYAINREGTKCFFYFTEHVLVVIFDQGDGYTYQTDPIVIPESSDAYVIDTGAAEGRQRADNDGFNYLTRVLSHIAAVDKLEINYLPEIKAMFKLDNTPKYYPNGVMQETNKNIIETIHVNNP